MFVFGLCHKLVMVCLSEPNTHIETNVTSDFCTLHKLVLLNTNALCRVADKRGPHYALINAARQSLRCSASVNEEFRISVFHVHT